MRDIDKIQRQVHFLSAPAFDIENTTGINNKWLYNRAPEGYVFELVSIDLSYSKDNLNYQGIIALFDGHEYTHWNLWPGVESRELLFRTETNQYQGETVAPLNNWECKEYTIGIRSWSPTMPYKCCIIIWYYLKKMSWLEKLYYAVIQPKGDRYKKAFATTLSRFED